MAQNLFSASLAEYSGEITNKRLSESIVGLKRIVGNRSFRMFQWSEDHLALSVTIPVDLPPLGNFQGINIKSVEPVLIVVNMTSYPVIAPMVFPDRLDFPKNNLAHLYVARKGKPPAFCLTRGGINEWYSNKRLRDLFTRVGNWLRDAASGTLSEDGDQFDPLRMEGYIGHMIYDYDQLASVVNEKKSFKEGENFAVGLFERNILESRICFKLTKIITPETLNESLEDLNKEKEKSDDNSSKKNFHFGYIVWSQNHIPYSQYCVEMPEDWNEFKGFCSSYGISTTFLEKQIAEEDKNIFVTVPVIIAIQRPKKIIGFSADIEFIGFTIRIDLTDVLDSAIVNNVPVRLYAHAQPLSREKAKQISGSQVDLGSYSLIAGCGAVGSKIIMHFARSGATKFLLADPDDISPHNLVRHALFGNAEGLNKAEILKKEISALYPHEKLPLLISSKSLGSDFFKGEVSKFFSWILDFTASSAFAYSLVESEIDIKTRVARAFLTDFGNLGIVYFEGKGRNPRIDDLQIMLYAQYKKIDFISPWLQREADSAMKSNNLSITVGVGCNSETTVLSDDIVSLHCAYMAAVIKSESLHEQPEEGMIYVNEIKNEHFFSNFARALKVFPMEIFSAINDPSWQIRIKPGVIRTLKSEMGLAMPTETGGIFVGCANYKTKTIHVTDVITAPPDSKANEVCFFRGIKGLPDAIREVNESTGNQLGYIGEWHTHPFGPNTLSSTDAGTIRRYKKDFDTLKTPLPVFLMIVTPTHILPYVY